MSDCPDNTPLGNSISVLSGFPFPSAQFTEGIGKPLIRIRDLIGSQTETHFVGDFDPAFLIRRDNVLIGMDGDFNVVRWKGPEALLNQRVCKVSSASDEIDERFLFWWLKPHIQIVHRRTPQTTVRHLSVGDVYRIPKPALVSKAQAFAAAVLDTVDEAIAKTEAVIAKLRQVRAGLLHDLLTRGLDHNGQLRDPVAHPEQFQPSPLGQIPNEWEVKRLDEMVESAVDGPFGSNLKTQHYVNQPGVRVVRLQNIETGRFDDTDKAFVSEDHAETLQRHQAVSGDLLVASMGDENHPLARACLYPSEYPPGIVKADCFRIRMKPSQAINGYVMHFMNCPSTRRDVNLLGQGVTRDRVNLRTLLTLRVIVPSVDEQKEIVKRVEALDRAANAEMDTHGKLLSMKSGLMTDLLTGRVRVPETIQPAEARQ